MAGGRWGGGGGTGGNNEKEGRRYQKNGTKGYNEVMRGTE